MALKGFAALAALAAEKGIPPVVKEKLFAAAPKPDIALMRELKDATGKKYLCRLHPQDSHILQCFYDMEIWGPRPSYVAEVLIVEKNGDHGILLDGADAAVVYKEAAVDQMPTCLVFVGAHAPRAYVAERTYLVKGDPIPFANGKIVVRTLKPLRCKSGTGRATEKKNEHRSLDYDCSHHRDHRDCGSERPGTRRAPFLTAINCADCVSRNPTRRRRLHPETMSGHSCLRRMPSGRDHTRRPTWHQW